MFHLEKKYFIFIVFILKIKLRCYIVNKSFDTYICACVSVCVCMKLSKIRYSFLKQKNITCNLTKTQRKTNLV